MIRKLEQTGALRVLLFLAKKEHANISTLKKNLDISQDGLYNALKALLDTNLIKEEVITFPRERRFYLTEKGKKVAEKLIEIKEILKEGE